MTNLNDIFKCQVCSNIVEVTHAGPGELVCCGKPMKHMEPGTSDGAHEKHVPVIEQIEGGYIVKVGSVAHPSLPEHYIEWIEVLTEDGRVGRKYLKPGDAPEAKFYCKSPIVFAREYCNLHGLWKSEELK